MRFQKTKLAALGLAACMTVPAFAADPDAKDPKDRDVDVKINEGAVDVKVKRDDSAQSAKVRRGESMGGYRAEDLLGMAIRNGKGKEIGEINDIVVGLHDGNVRYAAVSYGGFLGLGDKLFAMPWHAIQMKRTDDGVYFVANVTEERLENAPGFDQDNWPKFANEKFAASVDKSYENDRRSNEVRVDIDEAADDTPAENRAENRAERRQERQERIRRDVPGDSASKALTYRISEFKALPVMNAEGEEIAAINDVVVDIDKGKVRYVAVTFDDSWGYGEKMFAMPWKAFKLDQVDDETTIALHVTREELKSATGFGNEDWPNFADPKWREKANKFQLKTPAVDVEVE